ncbi:DUF6517 family protein [Natronobacterium gregoryi]|nr:DUF6517 family protein [Natronobacterium gregoryi]AFZ74913.1 hypothetical protein Natgr_3819 [Natronobacterium gregoryi SP2]PLK19877.1 hypothetical protein CYV19_12570 [Natronobacterium gregoryi SP2]SFJ39015.1 hypothetical protein SAMN05443661_12610 [Natronobacterium gregoryi]
MHRRLFVATVGAGGVGAVAGCLDALGDVTTHTASPAAVPDSVATEAGYEYRGTAETVETESIASQTVEVTNYVSEYARTVDLPLDRLADGIEAGVFGLVTTPRLSVAGEAFNPVADASRTELVDLVQNQYDDLVVADEPTNRRTLETLEQSITVDSFEGEASLLGDYDVDIFVDVTRLDHDGDHLVLVGIYPDFQGVDRGAERERIDVLLQGVEHGDDVDVAVDLESRDALL